MARLIGPACRLCRRDGVKLYLKGNKCLGMKCAVEKSNQPPGMHQWRRGKLSEYGKRLREKQKAKRYYGVMERQFKNYFHKAEIKKGNSGENLMIMLESRLDNVVFRGGFSASRGQARQLICHGKIFVNGKKVTIPSYLIKAGDVIQPNPKEPVKKMISEIQQAVSIQSPSWLERIADPLGLKIINTPTRNEVPIELQEQLIVEFFSK